MPSLFLPQSRRYVSCGGSTASWWGLSYGGCPFAGHSGFLWEDSQGADDDSDWRLDDNTGVIIIDQDNDSDGKRPKSFDA